MDDDGEQVSETKGNGCEEERRKEEEGTIEIGEGRKRKPIKEGSKIKALGVTMSTKHEGEDMTNPIEEARERLEKIMALNKHQIWPLQLK